MRFAVVLLILLMLAVPAISDQQEIELQLETPPVAQSEAKDVPASVESEPVQLSASIKAVAHGKAPVIEGASAVLMDASTGQLLYEKNAFTKRPIASTTKIMTAIVALERCSMSEVVTVGKNPPTIPYTSLNLRQGERLPIRDVMTGMLMRSANDAAVAIAEHVAGSVPAFAQLMNRKAREIGAKSTNFVNPNGLYAPGHYSTAYDLAIITRYALQIPEFNEIVRMKRWTLTRSINNKDLLVVNRSPFMKNYPGADGVKSGYIRQAGYCYVGSATRNGWRLISVVLKSNNSSKDSMALMNYGFSNFKRSVVAPKGKSFRSSRLPSAGTLVGVAAETLYVDVPNQASDVRLDAKAKFAEVELPVKKGQVIGNVTAYMDDVPVGAVLLRSSSDVDKSIAACPFWFWMRTGMIVLACTGMVLKYGGAAAKNSRRSRRRIETEGRGTYRLR